MLIRLQALHTRAGIRHVGFRKLSLLHRFNLPKPGSSEHDPDFSIGRSKADNGAFGTD
ncbi:hypothetical protein J7E50_21685 [Pedobacter sp. ISL-68]|uniref:hypothetical protein n=1 Tax=Pedobacter sp. ISL-68 TaxID=2819165 RepID=UPI001BEADF15|nr:hypothetical protein [Pedobacter sp. ISL-68]MBT2592846.1 hypothetical protein [Pedobacter sp. ISL-68]